MNEYKEGIPNSLKKFNDNNENIEVKLDDNQQKSKDNFTNCLNQLIQLDENKQFSEELDVLNKLYQLFKEDNYYFPIDFYQNIPFFAILFNYLTSQADSTSSFELIIKIVDSLIRESPILCSQFVNSGLFDEFFQNLANENYFSQLLNIFSYCILNCNETICRIVSEDNLPLYSYIESSILQANWRDLDVYLCQDIITFLYSSIIHFPISESEHINNVINILINFFDIDANFNLLASACQGIIKIINTFPIFLKSIIEANFIPKIIVLLNHFGPNQSLESINITRMLMSVLMVISYVNVDEENTYEITDKELFMQNPDSLFTEKTNDFTDIFAKSIEETPDFFPTLFNCCTHSNDEISKNAFLVINNLTYHSIFNTAGLAEHGFGNLIYHAISEGTYQMKNNAITCLLNIVIFAEPQELMGLILPETLNAIASDANSLGEMNPQNLINAIGLILRKLSNVGLGEQAEECLKTSEFYEFLSETIDSTSDDKLREQALLIEMQLGFISSEE